VYKGINVFKDINRLLLMNINHKETYMKLIFFVFLIIFILGGGTAIGRGTVLNLGVIWGIILLVLIRFQKGTLKIPPSLAFYVIFLVILGLSMFWAPNKPAGLEYLKLYFSGMLFWLASYNLKQKMASIFDTLVLVLALIFGFLFLLNNFFGFPSGDSIGLFTYYTSNHGLIGSFWAVAFLVAIKKYVDEKKYRYILFLVLGVFFLAVSLSRSAYLALFVGVFYMFREKTLMAKYRSIFWILALVTAALFVFSGIFKTTLFSRPYFIRGLIGVIRNPFGLGFGNFNAITSDPNVNPLGILGMAKLAHNIILEVLVGMGLFGISFVVWLVMAIRSVVVQDRKRLPLMYGAFFLALFVNFFFDVTYYIPTMVWLWFMALGLVQMQSEMKLA